MIEHDALWRYIDALRGRPVVVSDQSATQARIVASLRARRRRKRAMLRCLLGAALLLPFGSTSYALLYGVPPVLKPLLSHIGWSTSADRTLPQKRAVRATPLPEEPPRDAAPSAATELAPATPASSAEPPPASRERSSDAARPPRARSSAAGRERLAQAASPGESDEALSRRLYARAHELHFVVRNPEGALRAWDDYLARAPQPLLRIEAQFNRALCLVRLGRKEEALRELAPFANGIHGSYRQRESRALMRALSR